MLSSKILFTDPLERIKRLIRVFFVLLFPVVQLFSAGCTAPGESSGIIDIRIWDVNSQLTPARVRITNMNGTYLAPVGHQADFPMTTSSDQESVEKDVILDNDRRFAYVEGEFQIVPGTDSFRIEVVKGFRYKIIDDSLYLGNFPGGIDIYLEKAFDNIPEEGWYSGDVHVHHINVQTALLEMKAEDLNVCNLLISDFTLDHQNFKGRVESASDPEHLIFYNQEYREDRLGHINLLNLTERLIEPSVEQRAHQYPLNIDAMDEAHAQGGHVSWAHFAAWPGLEGPLGIILKKVDAIELLCTIDPFHQPIFVSDVVPEVRMNSGLKLWYRLLNCGFKMPVTAGTDKMGNFVTVGANRVYAQVDGDFNYGNWIDALNEGRTFVSNSPFLSFKVDDKPPGSILDGSSNSGHRLQAEVWSQMPIDRLEIIANGELVAEVSIPEGAFHAAIDIKYQTKESVWLAARAYQLTQEDTRKGLSMSQRRNSGGGPTYLNRYYGTLRPEVTFSHTSPVYIEINNKPVRSSDDANYFVRYLQNVINWLDESGSFPNEQAKQEVLNAFEQGKQGFADLRSEI